MVVMAVVVVVVVRVMAIGMPSLTFVKLAARCLSSTSPLSSPSASASSTTLPFSPHWVNKDILALTRVLSCLLTPANHTTPASPHHPPTQPRSLPLLTTHRHPLIHSRAV